LVSSGLCAVMMVLALFCLPHIGQDTIAEEDANFRAYLESNGWNTSRMGLQNGENLESGNANLAKENSQEKQV